MGGKSEGVSVHMHKHAHRQTEGTIRRSNPYKKRIASFSVKVPAPNRCSDSTVVLLLAEYDHVMEA